jgi:hypothetical protein
VECEFTGLDQEWCAHCKSPAPRARAESTIVATIAARYPSQCPECDFPIQEGETIHKLEPDEVWVHAHHYSAALSSEPQHFGRRLR